MHPGTNEWVEFECPLPDDILGLIAVLEQEDLPLARDSTLY